MNLSAALVGLLGFGAVTSVLCGAPANSGASPRSDEVLVQINGTKLTMNDIEKTSGDALFQARSAYYAAERKVIENAADRYILEQQAAKEGLTVDQLLDRHVNNTIAPDPSDESLHVYYEGVDTSEPFEAVRGKILDALRQRRIAKAKNAYVAKLRSEQQILILLEPPRAPISMKDVPVRGATGAPLTVLEFADFECPYCQQLQPILDKIETEFKGKIDFAYKDFPLPAHPDAPKAAEAAHCAGAQGKYWEYHDLVFDKKQIDIASLKNYSAELKLDTAAFSSCLDKGQMTGMVNEMASEANALELQGTPTIFVNGRMIGGNLTYDVLKSVIAEELSAVTPPAVASRK